ncbi:MAG: hypothetical protein FJ134_03265 [Deltaproteobacteria bacterium]|nr:hypothetical protein [Deltaproteobacteria bacterium]
MDDQMDRALEALKVQIKKEIVDNFFADRVYLEEDTAHLQEEAQAYRREVELAARRWFAFYQALGSQEAIAGAMAVLGLKDWPFYPQFRQTSPEVREELLRNVRRHGWTARGRFRHLVFDLYTELQQTMQKLHAQYQQIQTHLKLLNEDIDKFNLNYDFGLIAAQMEAIEGRQAVIPGGLMGEEREELSTRMRFKRQKLTAEDLPPIPALPSLNEIKGKLREVADRFFRS